MAISICMASHLSMSVATVRVMQEIGAVTPAATAALAYAFMGTLEKIATYLALIPVMLGIVIATGCELSFNSIGFGAAVAGCVARASKTVLQVPPIKSISEWDWQPHTSPPFLYVC